MAISLLKEFKQKQKVSITPLLKKSIDLLQLSRYELVQKIQKEIEINPFIEMEDSESGEKFTIDTSDQNTQSQYKNSFAKKGEEFSQDLKKRGIDAFVFDNQSDYSKELYTFFKMRGKRRR